MATPEMQQLSGELRQLTQALQGLVSASSRTAQAQQAQFDILLNTRTQLAKYKEELVKGRTLTKEQNALIDQAVKVKRQELEAARNLNKANNEYLALSRKSNVSTRELERSQMRVAQAADLHTKTQQELSVATTAAEGSFRNLTTSTNAANAALVWLGKTIYTQGQQLLAQNKAASGVMETTGSAFTGFFKRQMEELGFEVSGASSVFTSFFDQQMEAFNVALSGAELGRISAENRQMVNNLGGTNIALREFDTTIKRNTILTGSFAEGLQLSMMAASEFAKKGVRPTSKSLEQFTDDVVQLTRRTGMAATEAFRYFNEIASDPDSIELLRKARSDEREAILASQRALVDQAIALGMSAEQAKEATKVLNKMAAAKPLDRLKQAAKIRALGGALGVEGAAGAAQYVQRGSRATDEDRKNFQAFMVNAANTIDAAAQQGLPAEIFATTLVDKLQLEQYLGAGNQYSTSLGDALKPKFEDLTKAYVDVSKTSEGLLALNALRLKEQVDLILSGNNLLGTVAATAGLILATIAGKGVIGKVADSFKSVGKAVPGGGAAAGALSKAGSLAGSVLKYGGAAGAVVGAGSTVMDIAQGKRQESLDASDLLSPARVGAFVGEYLVNKPFEAIMGDSIGGWIYDSFNKDKLNLSTPNVQLPTTSSASSKRPDITADLAAKSVEINTALKAASTTTADAVTQQVKKIDTSNDLLTTIADMSKKQVELAEKQLVALTLSETERQTNVVRSQLRSNNSFGTKYGYV